jgi:phage gp29-like protein
MPLNGKLTKTETTALEQSWLSFEGALGPNQLLYDLDELLLTRGNGQGLKLYDQLLNDAHCFAVLNKLAQAITSREWTVTPASDKRAEKKAADLVREQFTWLNARDLNPSEENHSSITGFDSLTRAFVLGGVLNGRHFAEVMWASRDAQTVAVEVRSRDPRQFAFAKGQYGYVLRHLTKDNMISGTEVDRKKILAWSHGGLDGNPYGRALGRVLWWPVWFKRNGIRFWLKFVDRFAAPKPTGKYPRGATRDQIAELRAALSAIANETEIAIPEGMLIEYLEAAQSGTIDTYESLCNYMDGQISRAVLGETGTTDQTGSGGSRARDQVGNEVRLEGAKALADSLSTTFNRLAAWITEYNYPGVAPPTIWRVFDDQEDLNTRINRDKTLFDLGYRLNAETVASVYGEGYEEAVTEDKPALIASLGVPGVQAMTAILQQAASGQLPKENAIAVLISVFGIDETAAGKMVPEPQEQPTQGGGLEDLFGSGVSQNEETGVGQQDQEQQDAQFAEILEAAIAGTLDFAAKKTSGKKPNCNPAKSHFCQTANGKGSCVPLSKKCVFKADGIVKTASEYVEKKAGKTASQDSVTQVVEKTTNYALETGEDSKKSKLNDKIEKDFNKWRSFAEKKKAKDADYLDNSAIVTNLFLDHLRIPEQSRVLRDNSGNLQAGASVKVGKTYQIEYLATAPWNVKEGDKRYTRGAGTALMERLIAEAVKQGKDVTLEALPGAQRFYKKMGFEDLGQADGYADGVNAMKLSQSEAKKFLTSRNVDFTELDELIELEIDANGAFCVSKNWSKTVTEFSETDRDPTQQITDKVRPLIQDALTPWLTTLKNFVDQSNSLEEIRDGLVDLYPELDGAAFAEAMGQAIVLAELAGREEVLGEDEGDAAFSEAIEAALNGTIDFAAKKSSGKKPNCNPAKSHFCQKPGEKGSCVPLSKKCKYKPTGAVKEAADWEEEKVASIGSVSTNKKALDAERKALIERFDAATVEAAETRVKQILDKSNVFIRVGSESTLEDILADRFKTNAELGIKEHDIPYLKDDYEKARKRTEKRVLGIDESVDGAARPIYGYFGSDDFKGASHTGAASAYGDIAVKLKPEAKARATFTGADSFKSGTASEAIATGSPPPPNAASLVPSTRHGYDRAKLPKHYPDYYKDDGSDLDVLKSAASAKSIDELAPKLARTGNAYIEAQVYGGVTPGDIAELHFTKGRKPTEKIAKLANEKGIAVYVNGKKLSDRSLKAIKDPPTITPNELALKRSSKTELARQRSRFVESAGEEAVLRSEANLKKVFDNSEVFIRCKSKVIDKILADRFKSQFETGTSGGALAKGARAKTELELMDYPTKTDKSMRPIYGYWGDTGKHHETTATWYGEVVVRLKQSARERATFTVEDSLPARYPTSAASSPSLGAVKPTTIPFIDKQRVARLEKVQSIKDLQNALATSTYIEAQIHGQVTPDDIAEIIYTGGSMPSDYAKKWAKAKKVTLTVDKS